MTGLPMSFDLKLYSPNECLRLAVTADEIIAAVRAGADINSTDSLSRTALHLSKTLETSKALLAAGADMTLRTNKGMTVLHLAYTVEQTNFYIPKFNIDVVNYSDQTPLHCARTVEQTITLKENGVNLHALDWHESSALHYASTVEQLNFLINAGLDVNLPNAHGYTPLNTHRIGSPESIFLLSKGAMTLGQMNRLELKNARKLRC